MRSRNRSIPSKRKINRRHILVKHRSNKKRYGYSFDSRHFSPDRYTFHQWLGVGPREPVEIYRLTHFNQWSRFDPRPCSEVWLLNELINFISEFWVIFSLSFLVALTGAMSPGPLLTYTIIKSARTSKRGYLMGLWIIIGHAILEMGIVILLLLGFSFILKNIIVIRIISIVRMYSYWGKNTRIDLS